MPLSPIYAPSIGITGTLTPARIPVASGTSSLADSGFTAASGGTIDLAASGPMTIGGGNTSSLSLGTSVTFAAIGNANSVTYLNGASSAGSGYTRNYNNFYIGGGSPATSGATLVNSSTAYFEAAVYASSTTNSYYGSIRVVPTATTPAGYFSFGLATALNGGTSEVARLDNTGLLKVFNGGGVDTVSGGTLNLGVTSTVVNVGGSATTTSINVGGVNTPVIVGGATAGSGYFRSTLPVYIGVNNTATSGTPLVNSPVLNLQGSYWNGTTAANYFGAVQLVVNSSAPAGYFNFSLGGNTVAALGTNGNLSLAAGGALDTLTAGTLKVGTTTATSITLGSSGSSVASTSLNPLASNTYSLGGASNYWQQVNSAFFFAVGGGGVDTSTTNTGTLYFGANNATAVVVGRSGIATTINGALTIPNTSVGTTQTAAATFQNATAATSGNPKYSPGAQFSGTQWNGSASVATDWMVQNAGVDGSTSAGDLLFSSRYNGGSWSPQIALSLQNGGYPGFYGENSTAFYLGYKSGSSYTFQLGFGSSGMFLYNNCDVYPADTYSIGATYRPLNVHARTVSADHVSGDTAAHATTTAGTGAGTGPTVTPIGSNISGIITLVTGTSPSASATVLTVSFTSAYTSTPRVILTPGNAAAAALSGTGNVYVNATSSTGSAFVISSGATALAANTTYIWQWQAMV